MAHEKYEPATNEFLGLLNNQIGRVTRKFIEGYHIAVANSIAHARVLFQRKCPYETYRILHKIQLSNWKKV